MSQIANFMGPTWGPPGSCRPQMGPMLVPWTLLSGVLTYHPSFKNSNDNKPFSAIIFRFHYNDITMGTIESQITSLTTVYSTVYSGANQRKHQSSTSLAFVRGINQGLVNSLHKGPVTRKMFPFDDVIMHKTVAMVKFPSHSSDVCRYLNCQSVQGIKARSSA